MRIAVDARQLAPPLTGIGQYTANLLSHMLESGHDWFLYSDRALADPGWENHPRVTLRFGNARGQSLASLLYANIHFLRWARSDGIELFWSPRHHLPFLLPAGMPSVVTIHDLVWRRYPDSMPWRNRLLERLAMGSSVRKATRVIAVSEFTASEIAWFYPTTAARCRAIPEAARGFPEGVPPAIEDPYFLFVGTLEPRKNLSRLLEAFAGFVGECSHPHKLVIIGGKGWGELQLDRRCRQLGLENRVVLPGYVSDAELAGYYANAVALLLPSLYEGFGLPVVEAMQFGTPAIVSDRSALPEVGGDAALPVDPESISAIQEAITRLVVEPGLRQSLSEKAVARSREFTWERAAQATLADFEAARNY